MLKDAMHVLVEKHNHMFHQQGTLSYNIIRLIIIVCMSKSTKIIMEVANKFMIRFNPATQGLLSGPSPSGWLVIDSRGDINIIPLYGHTDKLHPEVITILLD